MTKNVSIPCTGQAPCGLCATCDRRLNDALKGVSYMDGRLPLTVISNQQGLKTVISQFAYSFKIAQTMDGQSPESVVLNVDDLRKIKDLLITVGITL